MKPNIDGKKIDWQQALIFLILGILIASNIFLIYEFYSLNSQIKKLKIDDVAIAQSINNILAHLEVLKNPALPSSNPAGNN